MADIEEALALAGEVATLARALCGGRNFTTGGHHSGASLEQAAEIIPELRRALDKYDAAIMKLGSVDGA